MKSQISALNTEDLYAEAYYQLTISFYNKGEVDESYQMFNDINTLQKLFIEGNSLKNIFKSPLVSSETKKHFIANLEKKEMSGIHPYTKNFLNFLVDKKRIDIVEKICAKYVEKIFEFNSIYIGKLIIFNEISNEQLAVLGNHLQTMVPVKPHRKGATFIFSKKVDRKLLGGLIIQIGSKMIDLSLATEIERVREDFNLMLLNQGQAQV